MNAQMLLAGAMFKIAFGSFAAIIILSSCESWYSIPKLVLQQDSASQIEPFRSAIQDLNKLNCTNSWNKIWPGVKSGDERSIYFMSQAVELGVIPPKYNGQYTKNIKEDILLLYVNSIEYSESQIIKNEYRQEHRKSIINLLEYLGHNKSHKELYDCYSGGGDEKECRKIALSTGAIMSIGAYVKEQDMYIARGQQADCYVDRRPLETPYR